MLYKLLLLPIVARLMAEHYATEGAEGSRLVEFSFIYGAMPAGKNKNEMIPYNM